MIVATSVATDARVLKEATTLVAAGHTVHVIGKSVPADFTPPPGVTVSSVGASSVLRREGAASLSTRKLSPPVKLARWMMLPTHRNSTFTRFGEAAEKLAAQIDADVVHAHDFTALESGARIAAAKGVPLIYDTHEFWQGRSREYRPTPLQDRRERRVEAALGSQAAAVITVGDGVASALRDRYGWGEIAVVRNSFPRKSQAEASALPPLPEAPTAVIYAGRIGAHRELETVAAASAGIRELGLETVLMGPVDSTWAAEFERGDCELRVACAPDDVDAHLRSAGLVLVALAPGWENHRLALPNKLFHAVRAGVPLVASDIGELAAVVREYGLGTLYRPGDPADLVRAVRDAVSGYGSLREAVEAAQTDLSWEHDGAVLVEVYDSLAGAAPPRLAEAPGAGGRMTPVTRGIKRGATMLRSVVKKAAATTEQKVGGSR